jgi:hypothetical protein
MRALWCVLAGVLVIGLAVVLASGGKGRT